MTAIEIQTAAKRNERTTQPVLDEKPIQAVGGIGPRGMSMTEIQEVLSKVRGTSAKVEDGTRVHIHYKAFGIPTPQAMRCAARAEELGLQKDRYTGRVHRVWKTKSGDQCITLWVELERDHAYRTFNLVKGEVYRFVVMGD